MNDKKEVFRAQLRAQAASLLARYQQVASFEHKLVRGIARETPIRQYLSRHLPGRIGVATGVVVGSDSTPETQHDIILFDRDFSGPILHDETASAFPVETVHSIIEVKSGPDLQLHLVATSLSKIRALKRLPGVRGNEKGTTPHGFHTVVSFRGPRKDTAMEQLEQVNRDRNADAPTRLAIDMLLVLTTTDSGNIDTGYLIGYKDTAPGNDVPRTQYYPTVGLRPTLLHEGPDVFARWLTHLINHLNGCCCFPPPLFAYFDFPYRLVNSECHPTEGRDEWLEQTSVA